MAAISFTELRPQQGDHLQVLLSKLADQRRTRDGTALASAARTTLTNSAVFTNHDCRLAIVTLNITAASGTGGLAVLLYGRSALSADAQLNAAAAATTATGTFTWIFGPAAALNLFSGVKQCVSAPVPRSFFLSVTVGDASSYTYSLDYCLIP